MPTGGRMPLVPAERELERLDIPATSALPTSPLVGRERELHWLVEAWRRATGPIDWDRDPRDFDRRARFSIGRATTSAVSSISSSKDDERRRGGDRRARRPGTTNPPALLVLLRGESGLGKTRLVSELAAATRE